MYLLSSTYAYRFSLQECRHSCRFPMGGKLLEPGMASETHSGISCQEQAVQASLPASPISGHCSIRYRNIPIRHAYAGICIFGQTCTLQDPANLFLRMRAYARHVRYVPTLDGRIRTSCPAHGILSQLSCLCFCLCLCVCRHMHIIRHCLLCRTRFPSGLYRALPCLHQSPDLEDALDREIGGTAPVARAAFHLVSIHSKCNHMFLRMSEYAY